MTIFLMILKILGWTLLIILGLVLLLLLLLLFVPFRYEAWGISQEGDKPLGRVRLTFLLHFLQFHEVYDENGLSKYFKVFLFRISKEGEPDREKKSIFPGKGKNKTKKASEEKSMDRDSGESDEPEGDSNLAETKAPASIHQDMDMTEASHLESDFPNPDKMGKGEYEIHSQDQAPSGSETAEREDQDFHAETDEEEKADFWDRVEGQKQKLGAKKQKATRTFQGLKSRLLDFISKIKELLAKKERLEKLLSKAYAQRAIEKLKKDLVLLLKYIWPRKLKAKGVYSAGSPDLTAYLYGLLCIFPTGYQNRWQIQPDFQGEKAYAYGKVAVKGRIFLFQILILALRIYMDKDCKRFIKRVLGGI